MIKFLIFLLFSISGMAFQNLGDMGTLYPIEEEDILKNTNERIKLLDRNKIAQGALASTKKSMRSDATIGGCVADADYSGIFSVKSIGQYSISGELTVKPGTPIPQNFPTETTICVLDASDMINYRESLKGFEKRKIKCETLMISGRGVDEIKPIYSGTGSVFPYHNTLSAALDIRCLPSAVILHKTRKRIVEFNTRVGE